MPDQLTSTTTKARRGCFFYGCLTGVVCLAINFLVDLTYAFIDPRIRYQ